MPMIEIITILLIALALDLIFGEPRNVWHPVAWLGKLVFLETRLAPQQGKLRQLAYGVGMVVITAGLIFTASYFVFAYLKGFNAAAYVIVGGLLLKLTFSLRGLKQAVNTVKTRLSKDNLIQARTSLKSLVSRDTTDLDQKQLISAAVESAAENMCDSFVAPLFYFLLFGVPGAIIYRVINTFDAMVGYHGEWEYLGKFAARLDDVANFLPARITGLMIVLAALICKKSPSRAWQIMIRDHKRTQSLNAGWTMSAIAGALGVQLEKAGHYKLGEDRYPLSLNTINASQQIIAVVAVIWIFLSVVAEVTYHVWT